MKRIAGLAVTILFLCHCGAPTLVHPSATLRETGRSPKIHIKAMELLDASVGIEDPKYLQIMHRILWVPGYTNQVRQEALSRLWITDRTNTIRTIRQQLPRLENWSWLTELCIWIANEHVEELDEALISSWAVPTSMVKTDLERPEYLALLQMHGEEAIIELIFSSFVTTNKAWKENYRIRCWELLHRLAERDKLVALLNRSDLPEDDQFLLDLQRAMNELGIVPYLREEILWIRELATEKYESFWNEAIDTLAELDESRRNELEMRDIPMAVSIHRHSPRYLHMPTQRVLQEIERKLKNRRHYFETEGGGSYASNNELFRVHKDTLTWGDAMAITTALSAMEVPEVRRHLFAYAARDLADETTEYGGVIALDEEGRFEILEFEPKIRHHNRRFNASQAMFDAAYTALFHFHFHAQQYRNGDHAGPGMGDKNYAQNTRANCLVMTYINETTMNIDYYRHGYVVVDLGTVSLP